MKSQEGSDGNNFYRVDRDGFIVEAGGDWDAFALENDAVTSRVHEVVGTKLSRHISGDVTKMFMDTALMRARISGRPIGYDYRCDSPRARRYMRMELQTGPDELVTVTHHQVKVEPSDITVKIETRQGAEKLVMRCSVCNHLKVDGRWIDPFEAQHDQSWSVAHTVCEGCSHRDWRGSACEALD